MAKAKRKWKRNRRKVERVERVVPPPEAAQHHRPWPMLLLLHLGPDAKGIDADEFEAAIEIVETFRALTVDSQVHGVRGVDANGISGSRLMSDRVAMMINVWLQWSFEVGPVATHIVEQIEDAMPIRSPEVLRLALRRWLKVKRDLLRAVDRHPSSVLTIRSPLEVREDRGHALSLTHPPTTSHQVTRPTGTPTQVAVRSITTKR